MFTNYRVPVEKQSRFSAVHDAGLQKKRNAAGRPGPQVLVLFEMKNTLLVNKAGNFRYSF